MTTYTQTVLQEHVRLIEDVMRELKDHLAHKAGVPDYGEYAYRAGKIEGLRVALELCDDAIKRVQEK